MADDRKKEEQVCARVTERMLLDLNRLAALDDVKVSGLIYTILRRHLYGDAARLSNGVQSTTAGNVDNVD